MGNLSALESELEILKARQLEIEQQLKQKEHQKEGLERIKVIIEEYSLSRQDVIDVCNYLDLPKIAEKKGERKSYSRQFRYKNPITGELWTGQGRRPQWFKLERAEEYLQPGMMHTVPIAKFINDSTPKEVPLTKELSAQLKTIAEGWTRMWNGKRFKEAIRNQYYEELRKNTPHLHYINNFIPEGLKKFLDQAGEDFEKHEGNYAY